LPNSKIVLRRDRQKEKTALRPRNKRNDAT
jgi:hypothetical protein